MAKVLVLLSMWAWLALTCSTIVNAVGFQFRNDDYTGEERTGFVELVIEKTEAIATPVTLRVTPLTVSQAEALGIVTDVVRSHRFFPDSNPYSTNRAEVSPISIRDFDPTAITVTFEADVSSPVTSSTVRINIIDDEINEGRQIFLARLELVSASNPSLVDLSELPLAIIAIVDNDPITIGFIESKILFQEPDSFADFAEIIIAKLDNRISQQTFLINILLQDPSESGIRAATPSTSDAHNDYSRFGPANVFQRPFPADLQTLTVLVDVYPDSIPEGPEGFEVALFRVKTDLDGVTSPNFNIPPSTGSTLFPTTLVIIEDRDAQCSVLPAIPNGLISYAFDSVAPYLIGTEATYHCNPGFILVGEMTRDCVQIDGSTAEFNREAPVCQPQCDELPAILNGFITYAPDDEALYMIGTVTTYQCDPGFILVGEMTRDCVQIDASTAEFNREAPVCQSVCDELQPIDNGMISYGPDMTSPYDLGTVATYSCNDGYQFVQGVGTVTRSCVDGGAGNGGMFNGEEPRCEPVCDELQPIDNGMISYGPDMTSPYDLGTVAIYSCNDGYQLITDTGDEMRTCVDGGAGNGGMFDGQAPTCEQLQCPVGSYEELLSTGERVCMPCPDNSFSTTDGANQCFCVDGYFRTELEESNSPCTPPPSSCRQLQIVSERTRANTITIKWDRPEITGRDDFYYNIFYSEDNETFIQHNPRPYIKQDVVVDYSLSGLKALTTYTFRVSVENGVSDQVESKTDTRRCETSGSTGDVRANSPASVLGFCEVIVWTPPTRTYGAIIGYDVNFVLSGSDEDVLISKGSRENFYVIGDEISPGNEMNTLVQVRARTSSANGRWSELVPLGCVSTET